MIKTIKEASLGGETKESTGEPTSHRAIWILIANKQPCEGARLRGGSLIEPCAIVPGAEKISNRCNIE